MGLDKNDNGLVNISDIVTKYFGVSSVQITRKDNLVYLIASGTYTGTQTYNNQTIIEGLPEKYRPSINQYSVSTAYTTSGNYVYPSRVQVSVNGNISINECGFPRNSNMRISLLYFV